MKYQLVHPLWVHAPAILVVFALVSITVLALPLPDQVPIHFDINGQPNAYGSPWMSTAIVLGISLLYLFISILLDEMWARQEKRKIFNWMSLFDEVVIGALGGVHIAYISMLASSNYIFAFPWFEFGLTCGIATVFAIILEVIRPFRSYDKSLVIENVSQIKMEVSRIIKSGQPLAYWEAQNPTYVSILSIIIPLILVASAAVSFSVIPWLSIILVPSALFLLMLYGGFRVSVTRDRIIVRMGVLGVRLLQLKIVDITAVELHSFSPIRDFGGYGIRFNSETRAYFLRGDRGIKITTTGGKKYLIGSDHPERLATVVSAVMD